jgi:PPOX class probable F420-dependent enzyme
MIPPEFPTATYLCLATFRKTGVQVNTPVWFAQDGKHLFVFSAGNAGKVKRLRNSPKSRVATCTYSGTVLGPWHDSTAALITDAQEIEHVRNCFRDKYRWQMRAFDFFSFLGGKLAKRAYIRITVDQHA